MLYNVLNCRQSKKVKKLTIFYFVISLAIVNCFNSISPAFAGPTASATGATPTASATGATPTDSAATPGPNRDEVFVVKGIKVEVTDLLTTEAKSDAFVRAEHKAAIQLMNRIIASNQKYKLLKLNSDVALPMIQRREITWERITSSSYRATVNIYFNPQAVQSFLNSQGVRYGMQYAPKTVIFPIIHSTNKYRVWDTSQWQSALGKYETKVGLLKTNIRAIRIGDLINIDQTNAMRIPYQELLPLLENHEAEEAVIIYIEDVKNKSQQRAEVNLRLVSSKQNRYKFIVYNKKPEENENAFLSRVAYNLLEKLDLLWKGIDKFNKTHDYSSVVQIKPDEADEIERRLQQIDSISKTTRGIISADRKTQNLTISYAVPPAFLSNLLREKQIEVLNNQGKITMQLQRS